MDTKSKTNMIARILGNFPVFSEDKKFGDTVDVDDNFIPEGYPNYYESNRTAFARGFKTMPSLKSLNGLFNFITNGLSYLYRRGVPEFSLNVAYPKGAVVSFNGALYISFADDNIKHVTQDSHWGRVCIEPNDSKHNTIGDREQNPTLNVPVGTILTVPTTARLSGFIEYVEGGTFSASTYPELYGVLGTAEFPVQAGVTGGAELPIGSISHLLSEAPVPDGWLEWSSMYGILRPYPELHNVLATMVNRMALGEARDAWTVALNNQTLPMFETGEFYLGLGSVGEYTTDRNKGNTISMMPVVINHDNTLNTQGYTQCTSENVAHAPMHVDNLISEYGIDTTYVLVGERADAHTDVLDKRTRVTRTGTLDKSGKNMDTVTAPKTLHTRIIIKAVNPRPSSISSTHKQVIKAY